MLAEFWKKCNVDKDHCHIDGADGPDPDKTPLSRGLQAIAQGFRLTAKNEYDSLERQWDIYDALFAYCCLRAVREIDRSYIAGAQSSLKEENRPINFSASSLTS